MSLDVYLHPPGKVPGIGPERGRVPGRGETTIAHFVDPFGSHRYVAYERGEPVAALQVMTRDKMHAQIANVYTLPAVRRRGWATKLLARARRDFVRVTHAPNTHLTTDGQDFAKARPDPRRRSTRRRFDPPRAPRLKGEIIEVVQTRYPDGSLHSRVHTREGKIRRLYEGPSNSPAMRALWAEAKKQNIPIDTPIRARVVGSRRAPRHHPTRFKPKTKRIR